MGFTEEGEVVRSLEHRFSEGQKPDSVEVRKFEENYEKYLQAAASFEKISDDNLFVETMVA